MTSYEMGEFATLIRTARDKCYAASEDKTADYHVAGKAGRAVPNLTRLLDAIEAAYMDYVPRRESREVQS